MECERQAEQRGRDEEPEIQILLDAVAQLPVHFRLLRAPFRRPGQTNLEISSNFESYN